MLIYLELGFSFYNSLQEKSSNITWCFTLQGILAYFIHFILQIKYMLPLSKYMYFTFTSKTISIASQHYQLYLTPFLRIPYL